MCLQSIVSTLKENLPEWQLKIHKLHRIPLSGMTAIAILTVLASQVLALNERFAAATLVPKIICQQVKSARKSTEVSERFLKPGKVNFLQLRLTQQVFRGNGS